MILFYPSSQLSAPVQVLRGFAKLQAELGKLADVFVINNDSQPANADFARHNGLDLPLLSDLQREAARAYGVGHNLEPGGDFLGHGAFTSFVADANRRVIAISRQVSDPAHAEEVLALLRARPQESPRELRPYAPVLYVPGVLEPAFCQRLIATYETGRVRDSGVFLTQKDGSSAEQADPETKLRRDHFITDPDLEGKIKRRVVRRIVPEVHKAFRFPITRFEEFKVACYDAEPGGYFRPHRDNIDRDSAHRTFAMTLNLNTGDYDGGHLRFPSTGLTSTGRTAVMPSCFPALCCTRPCRCPGDGASCCSPSSTARRRTAIASRCGPAGAPDDGATSARPVVRSRRHSGRFCPGPGGGGQ